MKKFATTLLLVAFVAAFMMGAMVSTAHSSLPKVIKCYNDCVGDHWLECCVYQVPGVGTYTSCTDTGFLCAGV